MATVLSPTGPRLQRRRLQPRDPAPQELLAARVVPSRTSARVLDVCVRSVNGWAAGAHRPQPRNRRRLEAYTAALLAALGWAS